MGAVRRSFLQCPQENTKLEFLFNKVEGMQRHSKETLTRVLS